MGGGGAALKQGQRWNPKWQGLCSVSLLGTNKPRGDLIVKTCWTCWQEQSLRSSLQTLQVCLLLPTAFQLPSDSVCFLGICFLVQGFSGGSWPKPCKGKVAAGQGTAGLRAPHEPCPALPPGGQRQSRSVEASKGLNVGIGGENCSRFLLCWQARLALNPLLL